MFESGVIYEDAMHAKDPHGILKEIFKLFLKKGGKFIQTNIKSIEQSKFNEATKSKSFPLLASLTNLLSLLDFNNLLGLSYLPNN